LHIEKGSLQSVILVKEDISMRQAIGNGLIIGLSMALLWHSSNIWRYGAHLINEPNILVLCLETAGLFLILFFGISKFIRDIIREARKEDMERD